MNGSVHSVDCNGVLNSTESDIPSVIPRAMTEYILLIQGNTWSEPSAEDWDGFFKQARASGMFQGGSEVGKRVMLGNTLSAKSTEHIVGYMRFDSDDRQKVLDLLKIHPVVLHGGSVELCELPKSG